MTGTVQSQDTSPQTSAWLRGLIAVAWADGHFDPEERTIIATFTQQDLDVADAAIEVITPTELAAAIGDDPHVAENFLRTAVMVALADRSYSESEDQLLQSYCQALGIQPEALTTLRQTFNAICAEAQTAEAKAASGITPLSPPLQPGPAVDLLHPVKDWLDQMDIQDVKVAHLLCKMIPPQCPFERDIVLFGRKIVHIPAMCKLNPLYEQLVGLRFRALCYLADECGEDIAPYC